MPDKTVYSLTDAGTKEWNTAIKFFLTHFDYDLIPFMIASFFAESIGVDEAIKCLEERLDYLKKIAKGLQDKSKNWKWKRIFPIMSSEMCSTMRLLLKLKSQLHNK